MKYTLVLLLLVVSSVAFASKPMSFPNLEKAPPRGQKAALDMQPTDAFDTILSWDDFASLTPTQQAYYIRGLQDLVSQLEQDDIANHIDYQARLSWLPEAYADEGGGDRRCIYAGWVSTLEMNGGRHCMTPPPGDCTHGFVQCNPLVYGYDAKGFGKCVPANKSATQTCNHSKLPASQIAAQIKSKPERKQQWSNLRADVKGYCASPMSTQKNVCYAVVNQLHVLAANVGKVPPPKYVAHKSANGEHADAAPAHSSAPRQHRHSARAAGGSDSPSDTGDETPAASDDARPASAADTSPGGGIRVRRADTDAGGASDSGKVIVRPTTAAGVSDPPMELTRTSGTCVPNVLLGELRYYTSNDHYEAHYLMDVRNAQALMCQTDPIPNDWVESHQKYILQIERALRGTPQEVKDQKIDADRILRNFNACVADARKLRQQNAAGVSGHSATLRIKDSKCNYELFDPDGKPLVDMTRPFYNEGIFEHFGLSVCNVQIVGDSYNCTGGPRNDDSAGRSTGSTSNQAQ